MNDLTNQVQAYDGLLRDICPELDDLLAQKVEQVLSEVNHSFVLEVRSEKIDVMIVF